MSDLAIAGDGSALARVGARDRSAVLAELDGDARLLRAHTELDPQVVAVAVGELAEALRAVPGPIFLARTDAARARAVQQDPALEGRVITEQDTLAIALVAMTLVVLRRRKVPPFNARILIAGGDEVPALLPLLMACGVGDIASWRPEDALAFPLSSLARDVDAVVDLVGAATTVTGPRVVSSVLAEGDPVAHLLALPGLLLALRSAPADRLQQFGVHRACALALAGLTPVDRMLPDLTDPDLTPRVARAVSDALRARDH